MHETTNRLPERVPSLRLPRSRQNHSYKYYHALTFYLIYHKIGLLKYGLIFLCLLLLFLLLLFSASLIQISMKRIFPRLSLAESLYSNLFGESAVISYWRVLTSMIWWKNTDGFINNLEWNFDCLKICRRYIQIAFHALLCSRCWLFSVNDW